MYFWNPYGLKNHVVYSILQENPSFLYHLKHYFKFHVCLSIRNPLSVTRNSARPKIFSLSSTLSSAASPEGLDSARAAGTF